MGSLDGRNCFYAKGGANLFQSPGPIAKMVSGQMPGYLPPTSKDPLYQQLPEDRVSKEVGSLLFFGMRNWEFAVMI